MCMGHMFNTPTGGVLIPDYIQDLYPKEIQDAWDNFHNWWIDQERPVSRASMPPDVAKAFELIKTSPIPEHDGLTGADSCYVLIVESQLID